MKKTYLNLIFLLVPIVLKCQIIADHTIVDRYDDIPANYISEVKKMLIWVPGESHQAGYAVGISELYSLYPTYYGDASWSFPAYTDVGLRMSRYPLATLGEKEWYTWKAYTSSPPAESTYVKGIIATQDGLNNPIRAAMFAWCYDGVHVNGPTATSDPVLGVHWYGTSIGGPDGSLPWGLDAADYTVTGNRVSMDTYLAAMQDYIDYCAVSHPETKVVFTTHPVDLYTGEGGYQVYLKNKYIRDYAAANSGRILFDYADILCYNDDGSSNSTTWNGHTYPIITTTNLGSADIGHIGSAGRIRLAKAMWWMLARMAGWDGGTSATVPVSSIMISGGTTITTDGGTLQMVATVLPANATNKTVTWSITSGSTYASINSSTGVLTALDNGTVTVRATATDGSNVYGSTSITITGQVTSVSSITVTGTGGATTITTDGSTLQMVATVLPANATNKTVTWSITSGSTYASINSSTGVLTALDNGTVTVRATATDGSNVYGSTSITITGQVTSVSSITVTGTGGATTITTDGGTLQMVATVLPANATNKTVTWSITSGSTYASINSSTGVLTALDNGTVTVRATATDGSNVYGSTSITITGQVTSVSSITVTGTGGATTITTDGSTLQMVATVLPANATNKTVTWSITSGSTYASINSSTGVLTALDNGTVTVRATATDGSGVFGTTAVTISNQVIPVTSITVSGAGGVSLINSIGGTLQLTASILPANATNQTVSWTLSNVTGQGTINSTGLVTSVSNGTITARATANDGSGVYGTMTITISTQIIPVSSITISGGTAITANGGSLQLTASVLPANATNKTVTWSITSGTEFASIITSTGVLTAVDNGSVTVRATAADGSGVFGAVSVSISNQVIPVLSITISGGTAITTDNGTLQLAATVLPSNATNKTVTWSITSGSTYATINTTSGLITAVDNGSVTVRAAATDGSGVTVSTTITISGQVISVSSITVTGAAGLSLITSIGGTLQLSSLVLPANATNQTVSWSMTNSTGQATISSTGLVTAVASGTVTARATANDGSNVYGTLLITLSSQAIPATGITVTRAGGATLISSGGTLQLTATISPSNATIQTVTWSVTNGTGQATISSTGLVTAVASGTVTARATANDGSNVYGTLPITISNEMVAVTGIIVTGAAGKTEISSIGGTLQLIATITPSNATNQNVTWSVINVSGHATINSSGLVTAVSNGFVTASAAANDGSGATGTIDVTINENIDEPLTAIVHENEIRIPLQESYLGCKISLYDLYGRMMSTKFVDNNLSIFDISSFHSGLYMVVLSDKVILKVVKVIIP